MKLSNALKTKKRIAGELNRLQQILVRENARRNDSTSTVDRVDLLGKIEAASTSLVKLKSAIARANVGIYAVLAEMEEAKARITFLKSIPVREGEELSQISWDSVSGAVSKAAYRWESFLNQEALDDACVKVQLKIEECQDKVDHYNAVTDVEQ